MRKTINEFENAKNDIVVWIETGKCGGDICDALAATLEFSESQIVDTVASFEDAAERIREGKALDALWHLATDPIKNAEENAAEAALRSSLLRQAGQVAASVYGGPGGAAAYSAWIMYRASGGDIALALKTGVISGLTAAASAGISAEFGSGTENLIARSILRGAVNGAAVAAAGGDQQAVEQAVVLGVATVVIRAGYKNLSGEDLDRERLKSSVGPAYCLKVPPGSGRACAPPEVAYIRESDNSLSLDENGQHRIDYSKLDPSRPHVGTWSEGDNSFLGTSETNGLMVGVSRAPLMNGMAWAHDQYGDLQVGIGFIDNVNKVGSIPPFIVLTYAGSGENVHDLIRDAASDEMFDRDARLFALADNPEGSDGTATASEGEPIEPAAEIMQIACTKQDEVRTYLIETALNLSGLASNPELFCRIDRRMPDTSWKPIWHAHYDRNFCIEQGDRILRSLARQGFQCGVSVGISVPGQGHSPFKEASLQ